MVGKPATISGNEISHYDLGAAIATEYKASGWKTGIMLYEFASDIDG